MLALPQSIPGVARVEVLRGSSAAVESPPTLLVEVPHGADRRADYDALRQRLVGELPADLHVFFHVNTDVGAWQYGRRVAERVLAAHPDRSALLIRSEIPRTFIDCNRILEPSTPGGDLTRGGVTAGLAPYVRHPEDQALLVALHQQYVGLVEQAYALVCGRGGLALIPHTYGPVTLGISSIGDDIVDRLREAHEPQTYATWPARPEVDLLTVDPEGRELAVPGLGERLRGAFVARGLQAEIGATYQLHPATLGHRWAALYPGRTLSLEVRRDLLVEQWLPFDEMTVAPEGVDRVAEPVAAALIQAYSSVSGASAEGAQGVAVR